MPWFIFSKWKAVLEFRGVTDGKKISSLSTLLYNLGKKYRWNSQFLQMSISACELRLDRLDSRHPPFEGNVFPGCGAAYRQLVVPPLALRWQYKPNICEIAPSNIGRQIWVFCSFISRPKKYCTCTSSVCVVYIHRKVTNTKISTAVLELSIEVTSALPLSSRHCSRRTFSSSSSTPTARSSWRSWSMGWRRGWRRQCRRRRSSLGSLEGWSLIGRGLRWDCCSTPVSHLSCSRGLKSLSLSLSSTTSLGCSSGQNSPWWWCSILSLSLFLILLASSSQSDCFRGCAFPPLLLLFTLTHPSTGAAAA